MSNEYPEEERIRLIAAWNVTPWGQKGALAKAEGFSLSRLGENVRRWSQHEQLFLCGRQGCANPTSSGQLYCSRRCAGAVHRTPDQVDTPLGRFLLDKLTELKITRAELAQRLGVSPQSVTHWLKGRCRPDASACERIQELFPDAPAGARSHVER